MRVCICAPSYLSKSIIKERKAEFRTLHIIIFRGKNVETWFTNDFILLWPYRLSISIYVMLPTISWNAKFDLFSAGIKSTFEVIYNLDCGNNTLKYKHCFSLKISLFPQCYKLNSVFDVFHENYFSVRMLLNMVDISKNILKGIWFFLSKKTIKIYFYDVIFLTVKIVYVNSGYVWIFI